MVDLKPWASGIRARSRAALEAMRLKLRAGSCGVEAAGWKPRIGGRGPE